MKKQNALDWAGGTVKLAELLEISHEAVSQWGELVPERRQWKIRATWPKTCFDHFGRLRKPLISERGSVT